MPAPQPAHSHLCSGSIIAPKPKPLPKPKAPPPTTG